MDVSNSKFWGADRLIEVVAVISSFLYTFLYILGNAWCWGFAAIGSVLFAYLCFRKRILAESFLQLFYIVMAVYGYINMSATWQTGSWPLTHHLIWITIGAAGMLLLFFFLKKATNAAMPLEDSFTTVFSLVATWMMVNYIHENYLYWMVIDAVSIHLYWKRKLYFASVLFAVYLILVVAGYFGVL